MTEERGTILSACDVAYGFVQRPEFLKPVSMNVGAGECWGIIGPNGAGKSTLLRLLSGLIFPNRGEVRLQGSDLRELPARDRAKRLAFMPQQMSKEMPNTVREIVLMGRFPHRQFGLFESAEDFAIAERAMAATQTTEFANRAIATLSGGEAQRVHLAAALAQEPAVLLLDEPTAALDLYHQLGIFILLRKLADERGLGVVVVTHDLNLAARFCTHVLLLDDGRALASGRPADVITPSALESVYRVRLVEGQLADGQGRWLAATETLEGGR